MVNVTPELTVILPTTIYGEPASVHVVGVEIVPLTFVAAWAGEGKKADKRKTRKKFLMGNCFIILGIHHFDCFLEFHVNRLIPK